ncbi:Hypothetical predicted protein [Mytilus galloprovincialis]|uniref:Tc1-like transposase DDE domain-containing protein n=1 Tax=Mytilus galloprovincialis TaxID=29158 RepID=A0A8B6F697_MYTGA|nr:Hypothetical predicted protein [Mytilus galloprovincialis]
MYHNFVDGTSDTNTYLQFMGEASHANTENGISVIAPGDTIIVDNSPLHRNRAEVTLANFFAPMGVTLIFMPVYSPDLSAAEPVFMKSKIVLKQERFQTIIKENLKFAVSLSLGEVTTSDTRESSSMGQECSMFDLLSFWGNNCDIPCAESCAGQHCFPGNGSCIWGGCSDNNCLNSNCENKTEKCTDGCIRHRTGALCNKYFLGIGKLLLSEIENVKIN